MIECRKLPDGSFEIGVEGHSGDIQVEAGVLLANIAEDLGRLACYNRAGLSHDEGASTVMGCILGVAYDRLRQKRKARDN